MMTQRSFLGKSFIFDVATKEIDTKIRKHIRKEIIFNKKGIGERLRHQARTCKDAQCKRKHRESNKYMYTYIKPKENMYFMFEINFFMYKIK